MKKDRGETKGFVVVDGFFDFLFTPLGAQRYFFYDCPERKNPSTKTTYSRLLLLPDQLLAELQRLIMR